jgi:hypothetical protein
MSKPKPPPAPVMPTVLSPEMIDQASIDTKRRERARIASKYGIASTRLAGAGMPPTSGAKTLLGA